jgi:thiol-disulfide isomerase/thioredoxin
MVKLFRLAFFAFVPALVFGQSPAVRFPSATHSAPRSSDAQKSYAKALKEIDQHKIDQALQDFRKADAQDGQQCVDCETHAFAAARTLEDYKAAREEATLLLANVSSNEDKARVHLMAGDVCLAQGGYRIFEEPFQQAESEYKTALELAPQQADCLYGDGVALAHLHQYDKARERFEQYLKLASPQDFSYTRAKLFATQPELARKRVSPNFKIVALDGKTVSMEALQGKVVLIDFWATWCGPCKLALPHLQEIVKNFAGQPLVVISISVDADEPSWKSFVASHGMTWTQYRDGGFDGPIASQFNVKAIPTTFTIDANGFVQDQQVGDGEIEVKLKKLLAAAQPSPGKSVAASPQQSAIEKPGQ